MAPIHWSKLFDEFPEDQEKDKQFYYADFQPAVDGAIEKEIELTGVIYTAI